MEDLRKDKKEKVSSASIYTEHLPRKNFFKSKKFLFTVLGITGVVLLAMFPSEIGGAIGDWVYNFYTGLTKNFK